MHSIFKAMKKIFCLMIGGALLLPCMGGNTTNPGSGEQQEELQKESIVLATTPELNKLALQWTNEYTAMNPQQKVRVVTQDAAGINDPGVAEPGLTLFSGDPGMTKQKAIWKMIVGRDAIIPIINPKNPMIEEINQKGLSAEQFARICKEPGNQSWSGLYNKGNQEPIGFYVINDESVKSIVRQMESW